jgi:hypothetical protein
MEVKSQLLEWYWHQIEVYGRLCTLLIKKKDSVNPSC